MTSKINSKKVKHILNTSSIKIVILVSVVIILILIYLKLNTKELYTTTVDAYFKKYFTTIDLYKVIQGQMTEKEKKNT